MARHKSQGASWETAAYFLFLAHNPLAYSNLGREDRVIELGMAERLDLTVVCGLVWKHTAFMQIIIRNYI